MNGVITDLRKVSKTNQSQKFNSPDAKINKFKALNKEILDRELEAVGSLLDVLVSIESRDFVKPEKEFQNFSPKAIFINTPSARRSELVDERFKRKQNKIMKEL